MIEVLSATDDYPDGLRSYPNVQRRYHLLSFTRVISYKTLLFSFLPIALETYLKRQFGMMSDF